MSLKEKDTIEIPAEVWAGAESLNDLENWLIANDPESIATLTKARNEHLSGELISLDEIKASINERRDED